VKAARELPGAERLQISLNNLGEALRHSGKLADAIAALQESELVARKNGDVDAAIGAIHNRALALNQNGSYDDALALLRQCRDEAKRLKLWDGFSRAIEGIANLSWEAGQLGVARRSYRSAFAVAKRHELPLIRLGSLRIYRG
jgi:tetratricopeptide (TPR) repeat protein